MFRPVTRLRPATPTSSPLTSFASARAPFSRFSPRRQHDSLTPYKVRFRNPIFTTRRLANFAFYSTCFAATFWYWLPTIEYEEVDPDEDQEQKDAPVLDAEEFAREDSFFIPLTWAWKLPKEYYKASDPVWREFCKLARDKPRLERINLELVNIVLDGLVQQPFISKALGRDAKLGPWMLDISFPDGPPQEYERIGIEIADDYIALSSQRIPSVDYHRTSRAIWPTAAASAFYQGTKVLLFFQYRRLIQALGFDHNLEPGSNGAKMEQALQILQAQQRRQQQERDVVSGKAHADSSVGSSSTSAESSTSDMSTLSALVSRMSQPTPLAGSPLAVHIFNNTFRSEGKMKDLEPPAGTIVSQGLMQVSGSRGMVTVEVNGFYDPRISKFVNIIAGVKSIKGHVMLPRRG